MIGAAVTAPIVWWRTGKWPRAQARTSERVRVAVLLVMICPSLLLGLVFPCLRGDS